jgi:5'-nucleotidase
VRVFVDMDGVLLQLVEKWLEVYNHRYDDSVSASDILQWKVPPYATKCSPEELYEIIHEPGFFRLPDPMPGSLVSMASLSKKHHVCIVTAGHPITSADRLAWIEEHYPHFDSKDLISCYHKHFLQGDVLIDDKPDNFRGFGGIPLIFDQP